jgi:hypothetical protein
MITRLASMASSTLVPRRFRRRFLVSRLLRWLVPERRCFILPRAVMRNLFLHPLCVFCFGIGRVFQNGWTMAARDRGTQHYTVFGVGAKGRQKAN